MNKTTPCPTPEGGEAGFTIEHILLSVTVVHTNRIMQYDDSCASILNRELKQYGGVVRTSAIALYCHGKTEVHLLNCECGLCGPRKDDCPTSCPEKPPIGLKPYHIVRDERVSNLVSAIKRYLDAGHKCPQEWFDELYALTKQLPQKP